MSDIKYLILDVDGTLTDGKIYMGNDGEVFKAFNSKDGYGIKRMAIPAGIKPIIITGRNSKIVENRCKELDIEELYQDVIEKAPLLKKLFPDGDYSKVAYIGDDLNDLSCMALIRNAGGFVGCPADAVDDVKAVSHYVSKKNGGEGAVRDIIEKILLL